MADAPDPLRAGLATEAARAAGGAGVIYELVNPSDPYTLVADDEAVACAAGLLLGGGHTPLKRDGTDEQVLPFFFGDDALAWFRERFGVEWMDVVRARKSDVSACLRSVLIGRRDVYEAAAEKISDQEARERFADEWHDKHRSSCADYRRRALALAEAVEALK